MCKIGGINCVPYLKSRSLLATYINDDLHIEIMITLPPDWPLSSVNIEGNDVGYTHLRTTTFGPCPPSDHVCPPSDHVRFRTMSTFGPVHLGTMFTFGPLTFPFGPVHLRTCPPSDLHLRTMLNHLRTMVHIHLRTMVHLHLRT